MQQSTVRGRLPTGHIPYIVGAHHKMHRRILDEALAKAGIHHFGPEPGVLYHDKTPVLLIAGRWRQPPGFQHLVRTDSSIGRSW